MIHVIANQDIQINQAIKKFANNVHINANFVLLILKLVILVVIVPEKG